MTRPLIILSNREVQSKGSKDSLTHVDVLGAVPLPHHQLQLQEDKQLSNAAQLCVCVCGCACVCVCVCVPARKCCPTSGPRWCQLSLSTRENVIWLFAEVGLSENYVLSESADDASSWLGELTLANTNHLQTSTPCPLAD